MLFAAADRLHAGNPSWSDAVQAVLLSPAPPPLEQHLYRPESGNAVKSESMPPQTAAHLHAAAAATSVSLEAPPAMIGNHKQSDVTLADDTDSSVPAADATAATAAVDATAGNAAATNAADAATADDVAATAADAAATADDDAVAADATATTADHTATAAAADGDAAATAWASQMLSGSDKLGTYEGASPCYLVLPAKGPRVHTAPVDGEGVGKPQHSTTEQTDKLAASSSQAQPQQTKPVAAQLPATQLTAPHLPTLQTHPSLAPALVHSSAASSQMNITGPSSIIINAASSPLLLCGSQATQLALSSGLAAPPVPAQHACLPAKRLPQQLPSAAASSLQTDRLPIVKAVGVQELQLLHGAKPICKEPRPPDAAQPGSTGLLTSRTHREHESMLPEHQSSTAAPVVTVCQGLGPLQAVPSSLQHSAPQWFASLQQPGSTTTSLHMQQSAPSFQTAQPQPQQQLPPQLPGPASRKLHSLLLQLERTAALHTTMQPSQSVKPKPSSPSNHGAGFPSVLLQDPGLLGRVQSTVQECAQEGLPGRDQAWSQVRYAFAALDAFRDAYMSAKGLLQADTPKSTCHLNETSASPFSLLPGPLHAATASAMDTAGAAAATLGKMGQNVSPAPAGKRQPAACKTGSPSCTVSERKGKGTKRRRAEPKSHDELSNRGDATAGPIGSSAVADAANEVMLRQRTGSAVQRSLSSKATTMSAAPPASGGATAPSALAREEFAVDADALRLAPCLGPHEHPAMVRSGLQAPKGVSDMADSPGSAGNVAAQSRRHAFPNTQKNSCRVDAVQRCHSVDPVECMLSSHSRLDFSDPSVSLASAKRLCGGAPVEQVSDVVQPAALRHGGGAGGEARAELQHQTPERVDASDVTTSSALPISIGPCTNERSAKDALLMLYEPVSVPGEDVLPEEISGHALDDGISCVDRPPPFPDVEGAVAYEVDKLIDKRYYRSGSQVRVQYLVRWKGYGPEDDTWQSRNSLRHARQVIQEYEDTVLLD